jgi:hypothetical protein
MTWRVATGRNRENMLRLDDDDDGFVRFGR